LKSLIPLIYKIRYKYLNYLYFSLRNIKVLYYYNLYDRQQNK